MSQARRGVRKILSLYRRSLAGWRRIRVKTQVWVRGGSLVMSDQSVLDVRVSCDGAGCVVVGPGVRLGYLLSPRIGDGGILLQARTRQSLVVVGGNTTINNNVTVIANERVEIGASCLIGDQVAIYDSDFHEIRRADRDGRLGGVEAVTICDGVWLGSRVMVLKGVTIGANSVIASGAVVTKSIPANVVAGGVPAKVIRSID